VALAGERPTGEVLYQLLTRSGLLKRLTGAGSPAADLRVGNIARLFEIVHRFADIAREDRVPSFVQHLDLLLESGDDPAAVEADEDADAVQVLTVHKAKGLEFPVVFMASLVSDRFPSRGRREPLGLPDALLHDLFPQGDFHLQEERREVAAGGGAPQVREPVEHAGVGEVGRDIVRAADAGDVRHRLDVEDEYRRHAWNTPVER